MCVVFVFFSLLVLFSINFLEHLLWIGAIFYVLQNQLDSYNWEQNRGHGAHSVTTHEVLQYEIADPIHLTISKFLFMLWTGLNTGK